MEFTIPNRLDDIYELEAQILHLVEQAGYDENSRFAIRLALDEALINAFKHGNREDPGRRVHVRFAIRDEELDFEVEDEGEGFEEACVLDPRHGDGLHRTSGRGIFLIRQFMSSLEFNKGGNNIRFTYHKKPNLGINDHGLAHWKFESAMVLELDPIRLERSPTIILESVKALINEGAQRIVVDLKFLDQIDSESLGMMVAAARETEVNGAVLCCIRPQPGVEKIIRATGLYHVLRIRTDLKSAVDTLS